MRKTLALTLIGGGSCAMALSGGQALQAYLFDIQGGPVMPAMLDAMALVGCSFALFTLGVRVLAAAASDDLEARALLAAVLGVFRLVPMPPAARRFVAKMAGLGILGAFE